MIDTSKLLLSVVVGGIVLGAGLSHYASPHMNAAPEAEWRERYRPSYDDASMHYVDAGPVDASPLLPWPGATGARYQPAVFPEDYASVEEDYASVEHADTEFADSHHEYGDALAGEAQTRAALTVEEAGDRATAIAARLQSGESTGTSSSDVSDAL